MPVVPAKSRLHSSQLGLQDYYHFWKINETPARVYKFQQDNTAEFMEHPELYINTTIEVHECHDLMDFAY